MSVPSRPAWRHHRPAPRKAAGAPPSLADTVVWTRILEKKERYRIEYRDSKGIVTQREIELQKIGRSGDFFYYGVFEKGRFKTMRADRIQMAAQLSTGHEPSIRPQPTYSSELPPFPLENAVYRMPTVTAGTRTWTVDLNQYTCTCPEKRIRSGFGYEPGRLGFVCPHMARAILEYLPKDASGWTPELLAFLGDPRKMHIENLS